jgi:hypothetical protein
MLGTRLESHEGRHRTRTRGRGDAQPRASADSHADWRQPFSIKCKFLRSVAQVRKDRDLLQARLEASEAELERERGVHRRDLRRRAKEQQEVGWRFGDSQRVVLLVPFDPVYSALNE